MVISRQMKAISGVFLGIVPFASAAFAQGVPTPEFQIPAIREPHHFVKLDNKYVRVLDVTVPGYDGTLFHIHENPYFWVAIGDATLRALTLGSTEFVLLDAKDGQVRYSPVVTHRVGNIVSTAFRNITVQIQARDDVSPSNSFMALPKPAGYQSMVPLDNDLVRVERLVLEPGQSTGRYTLPRSGILIAVHDGTLTVEKHGLPPSRVVMAAGDFDWHTGPLTQTISNVGKTRFEAIEAVWK
jgi:hypothetical protein